MCQTHRRDVMCEAPVLNYVLIFAGGHGSRMGSPSIPKQFIEVDGRPIIVHTLQLFEGLPEIAGIQVVCIGTWIDHMRSLIDSFGLTKVLGVVPGGETSQLSIHNGLREMRDVHRLDPASLVLIHDGVRPLVSPDTVRRNIGCAEANGNAITTSPCVETVMYRGEGSLDILRRDRCITARAPQTFRLGEIVAYYDRSAADGITDFIDSATMVKSYGGEIHIVDGNPENIKITTPMDVCLFRGLLGRSEDQ